MKVQSLRCTKNEVFHIKEFFNKCNQIRRKLFCVVLAGWYWLSGQNNSNIYQSRRDEKSRRIK